MNIAQLQELATSENLEKAIQEFKKFLQIQNDQDLSPKVDLILGNLRELVDDQDLGIITYSEASAKKTGIRKSLLKFLQQAAEKYETVTRPCSLSRFCQ